MTDDRTGGGRMADQPMTHEQARDLAAGYVLGALDRSEEAAVREHLATCGQPHPEFAALGAVVPAIVEHELVGLELVEPPASVRDRIMAAAAADLEANPRTTASATRAPAPAPAERAPTPFPSEAERSIRAERIGAARARPGALDWGLRIAAVIAIVASGAWTLNVQGQLDRARAFDQAVTAVVQAGQQPGATTVVLAQQKDQRGSGIAAVTADGSVVLAMHDLQATSGSQSYTAWVIVGKAAPVNVGDFSVDASGTRSFKTKPVPTPAGAIVAVTLEANAGNPAPKGPIVSAGQVPAAPAVNG